MFSSFKDLLAAIVDKGGLTGILSYPYNLAISSIRSLGRETSCVLNEGTWTSRLSLETLEHLNSSDSSISWISFVFRLIPSTLVTSEVTRLMVTSFLDGSPDLCI